MEVCAHCGELLPFQMKDEDKMSCQACGGTVRKEVEGLKEQAMFKAKPHGKPGKHELEIKIGDDYSRKEKKWMKIKRVIDRGHDHYEEEIVEPKTGNTLHRCREPLSSHTGHGSAKRKI